LKNFRKGGEPVWVDLHVIPVRDADGLLTHWVSLHQPAEARGLVEENSTGRFRALSADALQRMDPLTGLRAKGSFEVLLAHRLELAAREGGQIAIFMARVDDFERYVETFDKAAGYALLKRIAVALGGCYRRGSDVLCRFGDDLFAGLAAPMPGERLGVHAREACSRVADMHIHHPRSRFRKYVTLSIGIVGGTPTEGATADSVLADAVRQLESAATEGDCVKAASWGPRLD
jgi:diguanylate cyclase (GGDEF)-like protein